MHVCTSPSSTSKVMSGSHLNSGRWLAGGSLSPHSEPGLQLCLQKICVLHWSLYLTFSPRSLLTLCLPRCNPRSLPPSAQCRPSLRSRYLGCIQEPVSHSEQDGKVGGGCKLCASAVIFFITESALTQIMECTGSLSEDSERKVGHCQP